MKGVIFENIEKVACASLPDPVIEKPTDAIVQVEFTAVCGSDLHVYHGRETGIDPGTVMGHEFVGRVVATGRDVNEFRKGDRVYSPFTTSCGTCYYCRNGLSSRCASGQLFGWRERGEGLHGGQAELVRVPLADSTLVRLDEDVTLEQGLLLGDVLATGYFCALQAAPAPGGVYAVVGCGPVGLMCIHSALALGAGRVFAVDRVGERLDAARRLGAEPVLSPAADAVEVLREATEGRGADGVMEAVGSESASRLAFELLRPGGTLSIVGVHTAAKMSIGPAEAYDKNLTLRVGRCPARSLSAAAMGLLPTLGDEAARLFTHRMPISAAPEAYELFAGRRDGCLKVAFTLD